VSAPAAPDPNADGHRVGGLLRYGGDAAAQVARAAEGVDQVDEVTRHQGVATIWAMDRSGRRAVSAMSEVMSPSSLSDTTVSRPACGN
jgi:hypothetical protein